MARQSIPADDPMDGEIVVTTSDFVRRFGIWQEHALRAPVYILHRGRPRFVMISVETMQQLCAPRGPAAAGVALADRALLDLIDEIVLLLDADRRVAGSSAAARRYFGTALEADAPVDRLTDAATAPMLDAALRRVQQSGLAERIDLPAPHAGRDLAWTITPYPGGVALAAHDITVVEELAAARGTVSAAEQAIDVTGTAAVARLNVRGHVADRAPSLARFAGLAPEVLSGLRFASLIERGTRLAVANLIDSVASNGEAGSVDAGLLIDGHEVRPVRVGMAPIRHGAAMTGISLAMLATPSLRRA